MWSWPEWVQQALSRPAASVDTFHSVVYAVVAVGVTTLGISLWRWHRRRQRAQKKKPTVAIIGAGFGGLCAAIKLKEKGIPFVIFEKGPGVGGTWRENRYPGAACDIPSHLYSFSFELNPNWSRGWSPQKEILEYIEKCCAKYDLNKHIRLNTEIRRMQWNKEESKWDLELADGDTHKFDIVLPALGPLHVPRFPEIPGMDSFKGTSMHSCDWNEDLDLTGKRVAVIGSAASCVQLVPQVSEQAKHLYVFQRTPNWVTVPNRMLVPSGEYPSWAKWCFAYIPGLMRLYRWFIYLGQEFIFYVGLFDRNHSMAQQTTEKLVTEDMLKQITKPELRDVLIPTYPIGCKRILMSTRYIPALNRDNVTLVPSAATKITPSAVISADGKECPADVIVYATGFQVGSAGKLKIEGRDGFVASGNLCSGEYPALLGIATRKCPNLFLIVGPSTGLGHNSIIVMIEAQVAYITQMIDAFIDKQCSTVEVREDALAEYQSWVHKTMEGRVWLAGCHSWYKGADGQVHTLWPTSTIDYIWKTKTPNLDQYTWA